MLLRSLLIFFLLLLPCSGGAAEEPLVLLVRPDRLPGVMQGHAIKMGRDPFNWPQDQTGALTSSEPQMADPVFAGLRLNAIFMDEKLPLAIINGQLAGVGATINDATVLEIYQEEVKLEKQGLYYTLRFEEIELDLRDGNK